MARQASFGRRTSARWRTPSWIRRLFDWAEGLVDPFIEPKDNPPASFWGFVLDHLRPYRRVLVAAGLAGMCAALLETGLVYYAGYLVDSMEGLGPDNFLSVHGLELVLVALAILLVRPLFVIIHIGLLSHGMSVNLVEQIRWRAHCHLLGQSIGFFQNDYAGRIANRVMQTSPAIEDSAYMALEAIWYASIYFIGAAIVLAGADWRLVVPLLVWGALYVWLLGTLIPKIGEASRRNSESRSLVTGRIVDAYTNMETVKLFAHAEREKAFAKSAMGVHRLRFSRLLRLMSLMTASLALINGVLMVCTVGLAIWLWSAGESSIGTVAAAAALTTRLVFMTGWIMWVTSQLFQNAGIVQEGMETICQPHRIRDREGTPDLQVHAGGMRFEDVHHHYGRGVGGLDGVDLSIAPGERVGLVGRSGAGKSTLIGLLLRFHEREGGHILIDDQAVDRVTQSSLRQQIAVVTQDTSLLHRSVRDNILYGRPEASQEEVERAARRVSAHDFILELADPTGRKGYDAHVGERGVKLSGGQRQRIALARAVLKDAPILVLDEATSALDSEAEAEIQEALETLMVGKTVIAIAHRLSTLRRMDRIVVLDDGRIAEQGTHEQLLAVDGLYAGFWRRQSGGFIRTEEDEAAEGAQAPERAAE